MGCIGDAIIAIQLLLRLVPKMQNGNDIDISVIIPTYRRARELAEAIESVRSQQSAKVEIIVVDDCPDGSAQEVAESFSNAGVRYLRNLVPSKGRPAIIRNMAWPLARGEFIHFLDDDDLVPKRHYERVLAAFAKHPNTSVVFGRIEPFGEDASALEHEMSYFKTARRRAKQLSWFGKRFAFSAWLNFAPTFTVCSSAVVRRNCVVEISGFDPQIELCEDVDFIARAILQGGAVMIDNTSIYYRIHSSLMHNREDASEKLKRSYSRMQRRYRDRIGSAVYFLMRGFVVILKRVPC